MEFKWWGLQNRIEKFIHKVFILSHFKFKRIVVDKFSDIIILTKPYDPRVYLMFLLCLFIAAYVDCWTY